MNRVSGSRAACSGVCLLGAWLFWCLAMPLLVAGQSMDDVHIESRAGAPAMLADNTFSAGNRLKPLRVDVDLVLVPVTVTDSVGRLVLGLQKQDFSLRDNQASQPIQRFAEEDGPISVGLLIDVSSSMTNKFVTERAAIESYFSNANPQDDYFVVTFADTPHLITGSTQSMDEIQTRLQASVPEGQTALLDAVYMAVARMRHARYQRRALVIITDGGDNHSRYGMKEVKNLLREANVEVYAMGIFDSMIMRSFEEFMGKRWLGELTDVTGGHVVPVSRLDKLPQAAAQLSREMRMQYILGYKPPPPGAERQWHKIHVAVKSPASAAGIHAYYKQGYLAFAK
jgi:Ca-activated chloride channel family protein